MRLPRRREALPRALLPLLLLLLLLACTGEQERGVPPPPPPDPTPAAPVAALPAIALDGEGLRLVDPASGSTRLLAFGAEADLVEQALIRILGAPRERVGLPDCGAEPPVALSWDNGLGILLASQEFVGWSAREPFDSTAPGAGSMGGLGIGASRAEVEEAYMLEVRESSLGTEFTAGGIAGLFSGAGPEAPVVALWAGRACIYR